MATKTAKGYVVVHPKWTKYLHNSGPFTGEKRIDSVSMSKVFQKKPAKSALLPGDLVVEVEIEVDEAAFYPVKLNPVSIYVECDVDEKTESVDVAAVTRVRNKSVAARVVE